MVPIVLLVKMAKIGSDAVELSKLRIISRKAVDAREGLD